MVATAIQDFWRVVCFRINPHDGSNIRHIKDFTEKGSAIQYAEWVNDGRGKVVSMAKYSMAEDATESVKIKTTSNDSCNGLRH
jgi:hypothetical protein